MPGLITPAASNARPPNVTRFSATWLGWLLLGTIWLGSRFTRDSAPADEVDPDYLIGQIEFAEG